MKYNITQLIVSTHQGTHLDAPFHFFDTGRTVDELDLNRCVGKATVLDLTPIEPRYDLTPADLEEHEPFIVENARIIIKTDWFRRFPQQEYFSDGPGISPELACWFAEKKIALLGLETPGVHSVLWEEVHKRLLESETVIVEGLAHLDQLTQKDIFFIALPLKIKGRDGSPVRAVAIEDLEAVT